MQSVDAVLLDLGNVLVFHDNAYLFRRFADIAGLPHDGSVAARLPSDIWERMNRGELEGEALQTALCEPLGLKLDPDVFLALWCSHFRVYEETLPLVEGLLGRVKLALISNTNDLHARYLRPLLPILKKFDAVICSNQVKVAKPDPKIFHLALERVGVPANRAAFFDDIPDYVNAASALGIHGRLFTTASSFRKQLSELGL